MMKVAVGHSEDVLASEAVKEVVEQIRASIPNTQPKAGILFCSVDFDHEFILSAVRSAFPGMELIGCTTDGEMSSYMGFREDSLTLMVFESDRIEFVAGVGKVVSRRQRLAGLDAAESARRKLYGQIGKEKFAVILSDAFHAGISDIDQGIQSVLGKNFPVIGGASAAHSKKRATFQFYNEEVLTDSVVLLLFAGPVVFSCGMQGGLSPMGSLEIITKCENNVLYRIGDKPAIEYFHKYIGSSDTFLNYCVAVFEKGRKNFYVRSAPSSDKEKGSVTLNGRVPEGAMIQVGTPDRETLMDSCCTSIRQAVELYQGERPAAMLLFSCAGRKMILGTRVTQEVEMAQREVPGVPLIGFYCYGEFAPLEKGEPYMFHGATFITLLVGPGEEG